MNNSNDFVITKAGKLKKYTGCEKNIIIPDEVKEIGSRAFFQTEVESVELPQGLKLIGQEAFGCCFRLKSIIIPDSVTKIEAMALPSCLRYIRMPDALVKEVGLNGLKRIFSPCTDLMELEFALLSDPDNLSGLLKEKITAKIMRSYEKHVKEAIMFNNVIHLRNLLSLKKNVTYEDIDNLISYCSEHKETADIMRWLIDYKEKNFTHEEIIKKADEQTKKALGIMERTVSDWKKIFKFSVKGGKTIIKGYVSTDENLCIPEKIGNNEVVAIDDGAFSRCSQIKNISFPSGIETIGAGAFAMCTNREALTVNIRNTKFHSEGNCLIDTKAKALIMGCNNSIIPKDGSVTTIGASAFEYCMNIEEIIIPDNVTVIGKNAFCNCRKLKKITLSQNIKTIEKSAFSCCEELVELSLPESVIGIQANAFSWCSKLKKIKIGENVTLIGENAFWNCSGITIHTPAGSYAETYAKENNIPFVSE